ncbi:hypothetical protein [Kocuria massiliensis]|uniref:hypothetical protein n=1 Tax=Kocuria massiliensis TaxID=1926282 RepID=UPI00117994AD|nr:hypothetical protein [Kocuria massiliensis]
MAGSGALLSGGVSVASQKATKGSVDWKAPGKDAPIGGATGAIGGVGMAVAKGATAGMASGGTQLAKAMGVNAGVHGAAGGVGSSFQYLATHGWKIENGRDFAGSVAGGTLTSAAGANIGQASGSPVKKVGPSIKNSSAFKSMPSSVTSKIDLKTSTGNASNAIKTLEDMGVGAGGSVVSDAISGREISGKSALVSAGTSGMSSRVTDYTANKFDVVGNMTSQTGVNTLNQNEGGYST